MTGDDLDRLLHVSALVTDEVVDPGFDLDGEVLAQAGGDLSRRVRPMARILLSTARTSCVAGAGHRR